MFRPVMRKVSFRSSSSAAGKSPTFFPSRRIVTASAISKTSLSLWLMKRVEIPFFFSRAITEKRWSTSSRVMAEVGSSMMMSFAPWVRLRVMATICRLATERFCTSSSRSMSSSISARPRAAMARTSVQFTKLARRSTNWFREMFSATVTLGIQGEVLVDDLDAFADGVDGLQVLVRAAVDDDLPGVRAPPRRR